ncbi:hypothetical protein CSKR_110389, partial [Clonorchis sinensis]
LINVICVVCQKSGACNPKKVRAIFLFVFVSVAAQARERNDKDLIKTESTGSYRNDKGLHSLDLVMMFVQQTNQMHGIFTGVEQAF